MKEITVSCPGRHLFFWALIAILKYGRKPSHEASKRVVYYVRCSLPSFAAMLRRNPKKAEVCRKFNRTGHVTALEITKSNLGSKARGR